MVEDLKLGSGALLQHHSAFKRIAVVSDKEWVAYTLHGWRGWSPGSSPCSASTSSSAQRGGPPADLFGLGRVGRSIGAQRRERGFRLHYDSGSFSMMHISLALLAALFDRLGTTKPHVFGNGHRPRCRS